jgi:2-keto-4-pentenoate hydratase/2-oxohepta-3-ene-1,7-dioic acid hydratase in catechol pathway
MKLATFQSDGGARLGAVVDGDRSVIDLAGAFRRRFGRAEAPLTSMLAFIDAGPRARELVDPLVADPPAEDVVDLQGVKLLAPLPEPRQIRDFLCFEEHLRNAFDQADKLAGTKTEIPQVWYEQPIYYKANRFSVVGHEAEVRWPSYCELLDYELELACVIGTGGVDISRDRALAHVFGYTIFNDVSARTPR